MGSFSVLVSNPPYIPTQVLRDEVPAEVADFEPELALDGGDDGLDVFRRLVELAPEALAPGGMLAVELFEGALDAAADLVLIDQGIHGAVHGDLAAVQGQHAQVELFAVDDQGAPVGTEDGGVFIETLHLCHTGEGQTAAVFHHQPVGQFQGVWLLRIGCHRLVLLPK